MYVCICNALKDRQLTAAAAEPGVATVAHVFSRCGAKPKCGRCLDEVADMMAARLAPEAMAIAAE